MKRKGDFESLQIAKKVFAKVQRKRGAEVHPEVSIAKRARVVNKPPTPPTPPTLTTPPTLAQLESEYTDPDQPSLLSSLVDFFYSCNTRGY
jgi:hypothetical protein